MMAPDEQTETTKVEEVKYLSTDAPPAYEPNLLRPRNRKERRRLVTIAKKRKRQLMRERARLTAKLGALQA